MSQEDPLLNELVEEKFVGRSGALEWFYLRFAYRHMQNGVYYHAAGGMGKTWILKKIQMDNRDELDVLAIVDFFDTKNQSRLGVQQTIRQRLEPFGSFAPYNQALSRLQAAREQQPPVHPNRIATLLARADQDFLQCCQDAVTGREVVLLFDTFERVQDLDVGQWLLHDFLALLRGILFAIAGRAEPEPAAVPDNISSYALQGLGREEVRDYLYDNLSSTTTEQTIESIYAFSEGKPLLIDLICDLHDPAQSQFIADLEHTQFDDAAKREAFERRLVSQFAEQQFPYRVIWVMAYLWRRFDLAILEHIIQHSSFLSPRPVQEIQNALKNDVLYVKAYPGLESYLLHDEIQRLVARYIFDVVDPQNRIRQGLYELVVQTYYTDAIQKKKNQNPDMERQLRAEQFGYILEQAPKEKGWPLYTALMAEIEKSRDYDLEDLVWSQVSGYLGAYVKEKREKYTICFQRGEFLRRHNLFAKAERHYKVMLRRFSINRLDTEYWLGFTLLRQGRFREAEAKFVICLENTDEQDLTNIAGLQNTLGQTSHRAGQWGDALEHYRAAIHAATHAREPALLVGAYVNRAYIWAAMGNYEDAKAQCRSAIELLSGMTAEEKGPREIFAYMNLGSAHRFNGEYKEAKTFYLTSLELAKDADNLEAECLARQHLGINEHYWGRHIRRELLDPLSEQIRALEDIDLSAYQKEFEVMCQHQLDAWQYLTDGLDIALNTEWLDGIVSGLHRLGKLYRELFRIQMLQKLVGTLSAVPLEDLRGQADDYDIPIEVAYQTMLCTKGEFREQASLLDKAIRLFDLAALIADEISDFHRSLDTLLELSRLFDELDDVKQTEKVLLRIEGLKGYGYQADLFLLMSQIVEGNLALHQKDYATALHKYRVALADLGNRAGYAETLLQDSLRGLYWRITEELPQDIALDWCDDLEDSWRRAVSKSENWPRMLRTLEEARFVLIQELDRQDAELEGGGDA